MNITSSKAISNEQFIEIASKTTNLTPKEVIGFFGLDERLKVENVNFKDLTQIYNAFIKYEFYQVKTLITKSKLKKICENVFRVTNTAY